MRTIAINTHWTYVPRQLAFIAASGGTSVPTTVVAESAVTGQQDMEAAP